MRVALQVSGLLRETCKNSTTLDAFVKVVKDCRTLASCDLFMATWDTLDGAQTSAYNRTTVAGSSFQCVEKISDALIPVAVMVEPVPKRLKTTRNFSRIPGRPGAQTFGWGPVLAQAYGVLMAGKLRTLHEINRGWYDVAVRMRPDEYRIAHRTNLHMTLPAWRMMFDIAKNLTTMDLPFIMSCTAGGGAPGGKSSDRCFWGKPIVVDRVSHEWFRVADSYQFGQPTASCRDRMRYGCLPENILADSIQRAHVVTRVLAAMSSARA